MSNGLPITKRLTFKHWTPDDLDDARSLWGDPDVMAFLTATGVYTHQQIEERLADEIDRGNKFGVQYWKIIDHHDNAFVGCCGLRPFVFPDGGYSKSDFEVGFHLMKAKWGHGYGHEAAQGAIKYAFKKMLLPRVLAGHHPKNVASKHLLEKLGFKCIRTQLYAPTGLQHPIYELLNPSAWLDSPLHLL